MKHKIWLTMLLCVVLIAGSMLTGCAPAGAVVAKVGNEVVTTTELNMYANFVLLNYSMTMADITTPEDYKSVHDEALNVAIMFKTLMKKGIEQKLYPLSAADKTEIDTQVNTYLDDQLKTLKDSYTTKAATDPSINPDTAARKALDTQMKSTGLTRENLILLMKYSKVAQLLMDTVTKDITVSDADLKAGYDARVEQQKTEFADSAAYEQAKAGESQGGPAVVYMPEGYRYVKHILIALPQDVQTAISDATTAGDAAKAKTLRDEGLKGIQAKADEVLAKVNAGEDFDALMGQYGEDPGMKEEPASKTGYALGSASGFVPEFLDAALKLGKVGDVTGLVGTDFGYHIIKWVGNVPSGPVPMADVTEALKNELLTDKQNTAWNAYLEQLKTEYKVEQFPDKMPTMPPASSAAPTATPAQ